MRLIGTYFSPFARRVAAALVSRSIAYEHEALNGYADPVRARAFNPVGKVPILILDDGEHLIDSAAIFDHLNELVGPRRALVPPSGVARRSVLRLSAIAATILEQTTAYSSERQRASCAQAMLLERYHLQIVGGLKALDEVSGPAGPIGAKPLDVATISAVVAIEYLAICYPELEVRQIAPKLAAVAAALADDPAFTRTRPATH